ncbi:FtsX-like permease family protein [Evansella halocellulosilytica]|uniref:FtsX-like permease family protein n=1 Tax=Evansella halocellulosilytica TaxID=2011013 RepID=UPI000BB79E19|nr:ABC transporter permease [Evansella halocellulosilytica]
MLLKMLLNDLRRNKRISIILFIFMMLSALLIASGSSMIIKLVDSMEQLFTKADAPHYVQMHAGELDQVAINEWSDEHPLVDKRQIVEMVNIDRTNLMFGASREPQVSSVMDISFVKQNETFDFLLDLNNEIVQVEDGAVGVPIYYKQNDLIQLGDHVTVSTEEIEMDFTVTHFLRDSLMNPSIVHSKRFLVSDADYEVLSENIGTSEYLIEFQLYDLDKMSEFSQSYQSSNLASQGPAIDYSMFKVLNALTNGIIALVVIVVSLLLMIIAILCLRLTIIATLEEEYREIGVMKAIGISETFIKRIYLMKYIVIAGAASIIGYLLSMVVTPLFSENMLIYLGLAPKSLLEMVVPFIAVIFIFLIVIFICRMTLRKFDQITAIQALRTAEYGEMKKKSYVLPLRKFHSLPIHLSIGLKDLFSRIKMYAILFIIFVIATFATIVPVNFLNTIQSPSFISYMGIGQSDIRIDFQQSSDIVTRFNDSVEYLKNDRDVTKFAPFVTSQFKLLSDEGSLENIDVETGDMSIFPLEYVDGNAPENPNEIALSYLNSRELDKDVGETIHLLIEDELQELVVTGIYQDVTNGGRTAKATFPSNYEDVLWYVISLDVNRHVSVSEKVEEYSDIFYPAKVTHLEGYLAETFGETVEQLRLLTVATIVVSIIISILITSLFMKMLIAKDDYSIAILKSIGFSKKDLQVQYVTKILIVLGTAIAVGTVLANTVGEQFVSALWSFMGTSNIAFVIDPVQAYILCPLMLVASVTVTTIMSTASLNKISIVQRNAE